MVKPGTEEAPLSGRWPLSARIASFWWPTPLGLRNPIERRAATPLGHVGAGVALLVALRRAHDVIILLLVGLSRFVWRKELRYSRQRSWTLWHISVADDGVPKKTLSNERRTDAVSGAATCAFLGFTSPCSGRS